MSATYSIEEAARLLGIGRNSAYAAAGRGEIAGVPVIRVGGRLLVPRAPLDQILGITAPANEATHDDTPSSSS